MGQLILLLFRYICVCVLASTICAQENIPWFRRACVNCYGYRVRPGHLYFDGCNVCKCHGYLNIAMCTRRMCRWNECFEIEYEEPEEGYGNGYHNNGNGYSRNGNGYNGNGYGNGYNNNGNGFYNNNNGVNGNGYGSYIG